MTPLFWRYAFALGASTAFVACTAPGPTPSVRSVSPRVAAAGETVAVRGANFQGGLNLRLGDSSLRADVISPDLLRFTMPGLSVGEYTLHLSNPGGESTSVPGPAVLGRDDEDVVSGTVFVTFAADTTQAVAVQLAQDEGFSLESFAPPEAGSSGACGKASAVYRDLHGRSTSDAINDLNAALERLNPLFEADPRSALTGSDAPTIFAPSGEVQKLDVPANIGAVRVAVLDTGVSPHPLLSDLERGRNFTVRGSAEDVSDDGLYDGATLGHGTGVAALIAGQFPEDPPSLFAWNFAVQALRGGARGARILPVKVCAAAHGRNLCIGSDVVQGVCYAVNRGANVINLSLGGRQPMRALKNVLLEASAQGVTVVTAAGNRGQDSTRPRHYPAAYAPEIPGLIAVGATRDDTGAPFSSRGGWVSLAAPADPVKTAVLGGEQADLSGTSFAAPQVSAVAAVLHAQHPTWNAEEIRARIVATALATPRCPEDVCGAGVLDASAATRTP